MPDAAALPVWDLSDLYPAPDSPALEADFKRAEEAAIAFAAAYKGNLASADLTAAIAEYERIQEILGRIGSYSGLLFAGDSTDAVLGKFYQTVSERITAITTHLLFFTLELNRMDKAPDAGRYASWLRDLRVFRPHQLSDEVEKLLHEKEVAGASAWSRLFDETTAGMRVPFRGEDLTVSATLNKLSDPDRSVREAAGKAIGSAFGDRIKLFSLITNTLAKDKEIDDTWRHFPTPASYRNQYGGGRGCRGPGDRRARIVWPPVAPLLPNEG
jgi:oligoendopeptidase F